MGKQTQQQSEKKLFIPDSFPNLNHAITLFSDAEFKQRSARKRFHRVNQILLQFIQESPKESYLLPAVLNYIETVKSFDIINERYHISIFEFWLNLYSELSEKDNYAVRAKIAGKFIPRDCYQAFFPIGMDKTFSGTHFVAAHLSPDVDTMIASFWGWVDAFAARVGDARHLWSLPGGPPDSPVTTVMKEILGDSLFTNASSTSGHLSLSAVDFVTQKGYVKKQGNASLSSLELGVNERATILVDETGHYLGDWHNADIEPIRKIIIRFKSCLRWFENNFHVKLISLFAKKDLQIGDLKPFIQSVFDVSIYDCEPVKEFTNRQKKDLNDFFLKVLNLKKGLHSTFRELNLGLVDLSVYEMKQFQDVVEALQHSDLFEKNGNLREDRPAIFTHLEKIIQQLDHAIHHVRDYAEQLDVALNIKSKVFGIPSQFVTLRNDLDDILIKMQNKEYLTVVVPEKDGNLFPIGVVWANTVKKINLGTVSFRDFCNQEEIRMASYLTPISVIDHHKSNLKTNSPPLVLISDAQSCNVIVAEQAFLINDRYSLGGKSIEEIDAQIEKLRKEKTTPTNGRLLQRLLNKKAVSEMEKEYFIHPKREFMEYFCFLHAILDDTDLLTKVSKRDVECVVELLNRIKSLENRSEVEVVNLDGIVQDKHFANNAAKRILRNQEMYGIYRQIYDSKEREIEQSLIECKKDHCDLLFVDTKEQNGCCRVGQTKLFSSNFPTFLNNLPQVMDYWVHHAEKSHREHPQIDLHLHMISTIASAEEVYQDKVGLYDHKDQLWFWVPSTQKGYDHLTSFLTGFSAGNEKVLSNAHIEFLSAVPPTVEQIFERSMNVPMKKAKEGQNLPVVILYFNAGALNSRKAMISPYLPKI